MNAPQPVTALEKSLPAPAPGRPPARPISLGRKATYQDVLDAPPNMVAEIIDGALYTQPRPAIPHAKAGSLIGAELGWPYGRDRGDPGGWWILYEPELHFGDDVIVPDWAGWRRERMPECPDAGYCVDAPDWVCEILSPSTRKLDLTKKRGIYAREGAQYLWFVDPDSRTLEALALRAGRWAQIALLSGDVTVSLPPFEAARFPLDSLWVKAPAGR